jgi:hypothetical protein
MCSYNWSVWFQQCADELHKSLSSCPKIGVYANSGFTVQLTKRLGELVEHSTIDLITEGSSR